MILTLASLLLANLARYTQAKMYGLPLKMVHQAGIADSLDIWLVLVSTLGFGLLLPLTVFFWSSSSVLVFVAVFFSGLLGFMSSRVSIGSTKRDKKTGETRDVSIKGRVFAFGALITATGVTYMHFVTNQPVVYEATRSGWQVTFLVLTAIAMILHLLIVLVLLLGAMENKIYGHGDIMTAQIDDQLYVIAMRHIANYWILIPCTIGKIKTGLYIGGSEEDKLSDAVIFTKGEFIIRDISALDSSKNILCRDKYTLRGTKEQEQ